MHEIEVQEHAVSIGKLNMNKYPTISFARNNTNGAFYATLNRVAGKLFPTKRIRVKVTTNYIIFEQSTDRRDFKLTGESDCTAYRLAISAARNLGLEGKRFQMFRVKDKPNTYAINRNEPIHIKECLK